MNGIALAAGITREYLFRITKAQRVPASMRAKLSDILSSDRMERVRDGGYLRFEQCSDR